MKIHIEKLTPEKMSEMKIKTWGVWEKEPSTFPWHYDDKESCYILEGKVKVKTDEEEVEFGKGDFIVFPEGLDCTWNIIEKVKKHYKFG